MKKRFLLPLLLGLAAMLCLFGCGASPIGKFDAASVSVGVGQKETVTFTLSEGVELEGDEEFVWASSDESVATVEGKQFTATVTGVAVGSATVTLTMNGKEIASCSVEVKLSPLSITVPSGMLVLVKNAQATVRLKSTSPILDEDITWESSDATIGSVEYQGRIAIVTALKRGSCTITARCGEDKASFTLIVGKN